MDRLDRQQREALEQAATWHSLLQSEHATEHDRSAWQRWLEERGENAWAWRQVELTLGQFGRLPASLAPRALLQAERNGRLNRRTLLKGFVLVAGGTALGYGGLRYTRTAGWDADLRSPLGERFGTTLPDGTRVQLNSDSAVDVAYDAHQRQLILRRGELLVTTAPDSLNRPFLVQVPQGTVQALGTRFAVRLQDDSAQVAVFEHRVRLTPALGQPLLLEAGQQCSLSADAAGRPFPVSPGQDAWSSGLLVANRQRLDEFLTELARYRSGWLHCDPAIAGLRISGTFSLDDTDKALRAVASSLPVRVVQRTRYWVKVVPR
nr:FecR domain-containing protein [Pseudomonas citronellolis]